MTTDNEAAAVEALRQIAGEMRERRVSHGRHTSPTLEAWAGRIDAAIAAHTAASAGEVVGHLYVSDHTVQLCPIPAGKLPDSKIRQSYGNGTHDLFVRAGPKGDVDERLASMIEHGMSGVDWSPAAVPADALRELAHHFLSMSEQDDAFEYAYEKLAALIPKGADHEQR